MDKARLDMFLVDKGLFESRSKAQAAIMAGEVLVNEQKIDKPGTLVKADAQIRLLGNKLPFVSRGGLKLAKAVEVFPIDLQDKIVADLGASTGGFTDCALQHGAKKVYAIDVGYGQLAWKLRQDPRVINMERTNVRFLEGNSLPEKIQIATIDVAFISLDKVLPSTYKILAEDGEVIALIKPQFEAGRENVGKKGVVKDKVIHLAVIEKVLTEATSLGFVIKGLDYSPVKGPEGNIEYLLYLAKQGETTFNPTSVAALVAASHDNLK